MTETMSVIEEFEDRPCGMIFEFKKMKDAKAFASAVKTRFGVDGRVFDDADEAARHHWFPWVQYPPVVHIDRVWPDTEAEARAVVQRFGLTAREINAYGFRFLGAVHCAAEMKVDKLAKEFGGKFVGT
jgi:hypothetical protein